MGKLSSSIWIVVVRRISVICGVWRKPIYMIWETLLECILAKMLRKCWPARVSRPSCLKREGSHHRGLISWPWCTRLGTPRAERSQVAISSSSIDDRGGICTSSPRRIRVAKSYKAIAPGASSVLISNNHSLQNFPKLFKVEMHSFTFCLPSQTSHKNFGVRCISKYLPIARSSSFHGCLPMPPRSLAMFYLSKIKTVTIPASTVRLLRAGYQELKQTDKLWAQ